MFHHTATARRWALQTISIALLALLAAALFPPAVAQRPLAELAPPDTLVTLGYTAQDRDLGGLGEAMAALDWSRLRELIERGGAALGDDDIAEMFTMMDAGMDEMLAEFEAMCSGLGEPAERLLDPEVLDEGLLTVSQSPFNPMPSVTAFARIDPARAADAAAVQEALARCFSDTTFEQDGVTIYLLADGSDQPLLLSTVEDVYMIGTNPDTLRAAIRRASGGDEPSLADTGLWQASARLSAGGFGFGVDFAAVATTLEGFVGMMAGDPAGTYAAERGLAALRTLGGFAGRLGLTEEGILFESLLAVDPEGGDPELAALLLCSTCTVSRPLLAPAEVVGVDSQYLPVRELFAYVQSWLDGIGPLVGEDLDLRRLLREEFDFDLDVALLDWIGNQVHTLQLEPFSPELGKLIYGPAMAYVIPVASVEQAEAGLDLIGALLGPLALEMFGMMSGVSGVGPDMGFSFLDAGVAFREIEYRGVGIRRVQAGPNLDLGIAFIGNQLVIGSPLAAIETLIDTFEGGASLLENRAYARVAEATPDAVTSFSYQDYAAHLTGVHALVDIMTQPLATFIVAGIVGSTESVGGGDFDDFGGFGGGFADLFGITPQTFLLEGGGITVGGELTEADENNLAEYADYFDLTGLESGDRVTVVVTSDAFDTYLNLIDADAEEILLSDDDSPDTTRSELSFVVEPGVRYWVEVLSFGGFSTGPYQLTIEVERATAPIEPEGMDVVEVAPPTFGEILDALEVMPEAVAVLANHIESGEGYARVEGDTMYLRHLIRVRW